jgi:single-stranded-DNA-specific exonuclease
VEPVEKRWVFASREPALEARLARDLRVSPVTAQLLVARGIRDLPSARDFLRPALDTLPTPWR